MGYTLLAGTETQPWQQHLLGHSLAHGAPLYQALAPDLTPPAWQAVLEKHLFKYRAPQNPSIPPAKEGMPPQDACVVDITGMPTILLHQHNLLKPFFNGSFDAKALQISLVQGIAPTIGWAMRNATDSPWYVLIQAEIAVREPLALQEALSLCGERLQQLLARGMHKLKAGCPLTVPFIPLQQPTPFSYVTLALKQLKLKVPPGQSH